jgi:formate dehydrogenase (coenzyme F420) beta subunit
MAITARLDVKEKDLTRSLREFFKSILALEEIKAILVPQHLPMKNRVMPTLVTDPEHLEGVDPLSPAFPMNAAKIASRLTRKPMGAKIAAVLRPCEIRAFHELVKLKQGRTEEIVIIGIDCLGAYQNKDYARFAEQKSGNDGTLHFCRSVLRGNGGEIEGADLAPACKACEHPLPANADILIGLYGVETDDYLLVQSQTASGEEILSRLNLSGIAEPAARRSAVTGVIEKRKLFRDKMYADTREAVNSLEKISAFLSGCVNCYNCRVACPVCYCKECVFVTDAFNHDPVQYLRWAGHKGIIKMPTDTLFYHITRMAHMSSACVGCGQCSNACPNDIPVMELFRAVASRTQEAFAYEPGRSLEENPPLSVFREDEFEEVVGIK